MSGGLGRRVPQEWDHVEKYPFTAEAVSTVEKNLGLPWWHWLHDQGAEGACVGFGGSMLMAIVNTNQLKAKGSSTTVRYDPWWLWNESKKIDEWPDTNPGDDNGTSVKASMDVLRNQGHIRIDRAGKRRWGNNPDPEAGVAANRWATNFDQMRAAIGGGTPISIGVNWYSNFDNPVKKSNGESWIGEGSLGRIRGGHCVCVYAASDRREAFKIKNSWGKDYPLVWMPYGTMQVLLQQDGEATLITDR